MALLLALGLLVNGFPLLLGTGHSVLGTLRLPGVLQRIPVAYLVAAVAALFLRPRYQVVLAAALLVGYWAALQWAPVPGYGAAPSSWCGGPPWRSCTGCAGSSASRGAGGRPPEPGP